MSGPKRVVGQVSALIEGVLDDDKMPALLGGEHTITVGAVRACADRFEDLSVLYLGRPRRSPGIVHGNAMGSRLRCDESF